MRIGVSSYSFWRYMEQTGASYTDICTLARDMGYDGIEFLTLDTAIEPAEDAPALADKIRAHCEKIGLEICAYTVKAEFFAGDIAAEVERIKGCVDVAVRLGAKVMRHDATWDKSEPDWRKVVAAMAAPIREVAAYAQTKGVKTCTENHGFFIQDANRVESLILAVDHPNYGWLVDIGNFACADEDSVHAVAIAAPYAIHAHAKDFLIKPRTAPSPGEGWFDSRHGNHLRGTIVGHGDIPLAQCIAMLRESGYDGWLSYEFEGLEENLRALEIGLANLRAMIS